MTLNERYRIHNKPKSNKTFLIYLLLFLLFFFSTSFARYLSNSNATLGLELANWSIKLNGNEITQDTKLIKNEIDLIVTENKTDDGLIKAGQKGYFDIVIDPQYTEVSLKYKLIIDTSSLPSEIKLLNYSINDFSTKKTMPANKTLTGQILLNEKTKLDTSDKKSFRIYWEWPAEEYKIEDIKTSYKVRTKIELEQII